MNIQAIKNINLDKVIEMEEAIAMSADIRNFEAEYEKLGMPVPDWLVKSADILREEIARRTRAADLADLKRLENELEAYKTVGEKKNEAQKRLAALQSKLGMSTARSGR